MFYLGRWLAKGYSGDSGVSYCDLSRLVDVSMDQWINGSVVYSVVHSVVLAVDGMKSGSSRENPRLSFGAAVPTSELLPWGPIPDSRHRIRGRRLRVAPFPRPCTWDGTRRGTVPCWCCSIVRGRKDGTSYSPEQYPSCEGSYGVQCLRRMTRTCTKYRRSRQNVLLLTVSRTVQRTTFHRQVPTEPPSSTSNPHRASRLAWLSMIPHLLFDQDTGCWLWNPRYAA